MEVKVSPTWLIFSVLHFLMSKSDANAYYASLTTNGNCPYEFLLLHNKRPSLSWVVLARNLS